MNNSTMNTYNISAFKLRFNVPDAGFGIKKDSENIRAAAEDAVLNVLLIASRGEVDKGFSLLATKSALVGYLTARHRRSRY